MCVVPDIKPSVHMAGRYSVVMRSFLFLLLVVFHFEALSHNLAWFEEVENSRSLLYGADSFLLYLGS